MAQFGEPRRRQQRRCLARHGAVNRVPTGAPDNNASVTCGPSPALIGSERPKYAAGVYWARVLSVEIIWQERLGAWKANVRMNLVQHDMTVIGPISKFFHLGRNPKKPEIGRNSDYAHAWSMATDAPLGKLKNLSPEVFTDKVFEVVVLDCTRDAKGRDYSTPERYSIVSEFRRRMWP